MLQYDFDMAQVVAIPQNIVDQFAARCAQLLNGLIRSKGGSATTFMEIVLLVTRCIVVIEITNSPMYYLPDDGPHSSNQNRLR